MPGREVIRISICLDLKIRSRASSNLAAIGYSVRNMYSSPVLKDRSKYRQK